MGQVVLLQPATLEAQFVHVAIDDSRARKILGYVFTLAPFVNLRPLIYRTRYRPQWEMAQIIRYTVDELESGRTARKHGLQLA